MSGYWKKIKLSKDSLKPPARAYHCSISIAHEDKHFLFIFGGKSKDRTFNDVWFFKLNNKEWTQIITNGEHPSPRYYSEMTRIQNKLVVFGGKNYELKMQESGPVPTKSYLNDIYVLDLGTSTWYNASIANMVIPSPRCLHKMISLKNYIYLIGGGPDEGSSDMFKIELKESVKEVALPHYIQQQEQQEVMDYTQESPSLSSSDVFDYRIASKVNHIGV